MVRVLMTARPSGGGRPVPVGPGRCLQYSTDMAVENNGPLPGSGADRLPLSRQRRGVLQYLRGRSGPVTATALAQVWALPAHTVREHPGAPVGAGLVVRQRSAQA